MNNKGIRNTQRVRRGMALLLIMALFLNTVIAVPQSKASDGDSQTKQVFTDLGYRLTVSQSSGWDNGYAAEVVVTNTGAEELRNWSVAAVMREGEIENSWNAASKKPETGEVIFESASHNMVIRAGESASFGFQVSGGTFSDITSLKLVQGDIRNTSQADVEFRETNSWDGHKIIEGTITNKSDTTMRDWCVSLGMEGEITNIWNAVVISEDGGSFMIRNCDYNAVIEAGHSITFGFEVLCDIDSFSGIQNVQIYAAQGEKPGVTRQPAGTPTPVPAPTFTPAVTVKPNVTDTPVPTPAATGKTDTEDDISEDDIEFVSVENRDWNMDMIHANDKEVETAKNNIERKIKVTMLDSGINYSREVEVAARRNFVEGEDEMTCLYEDGSGHGTAIAEVLASNPKTVSEKEDSHIETDDEFGEYTYYGDAEDEDDEITESGEAIGDMEQNTVSFADLLDSGYEWTEGVNPNIELYSGKILDEDNETTVNRAVAGIEWAIENDTDILCLSIGMDEDSDKLHKAVQKAASSGMLIIAAVGDDEKIDYPAAYPEVMSVGMVNSMGETTGIRSEVVAPGDSIVSRGAFDSMQIFSGSSMAVPHVAGLASILWQRDTSKSAAFIRGLMDVSANPVPNDTSCQYGLIDCRYALQSYEAFEQQVQSDRGMLADIAGNNNADDIKEEVAAEIANESAVETEAEMEKLHGNWASDFHTQFVSKKYERKWTNGKKYVGILQRGLSFVDIKKDNPACYGMREHPWFHGFYGGLKDGKGGKTPVSNYMTSFRTLLELADGMRKTGEIKKLSPKSKYPAVENALEGIQKAFGDEGKVGSQTWKAIDEHCAKSGDAIPKDCRSLLIYGMALHTLGDTFSHSSFGMKEGTGDKKGSIVWRRYTHGSDKNWYADNTESRKLRYDSAKRVTQRGLDKIRLNDKGLAGYSNIGTAVNTFFAPKEFKKLKAYWMEEKGRQEVILIKMSYLKEGFVLKDFSGYYEQEEKITGRTSSGLTNYKRYVDKKEAENQIGQCKVMKLMGKKLIPGLKAGAKVELKREGKTIASLNVKEDNLAFIISGDKEYEMVSSDSQVTQKIGTIENGEMYDAIGRKMKTAKPVSGDEEDVDAELGETENLKVFETQNCERSTDCLVMGKVVIFDISKGTSSRESMPGLEGVRIRAVSRDTDKVYQTVTEPDGSYRLQIPAGAYDVTYEKGEKYTVIHQFLTAKGDGYNNSFVEMLSDDWFGNGYMDGYLFDHETGCPLADASIKIYKDIEYYGEDMLAASVKTDENGYFKTDMLAAGAYTFVISKEGYAAKAMYETMIGGVHAKISRLELEREGGK